MTEPTPSVHTLRTQMEETRTELEELRDTLRVRAHLAGMEVKQRLDELEERFHATSESLKQLRDDARSELLGAAHAGLTEVRKGVRQLRSSLDAKQN